MVEMDSGLSQDVLDMYVERIVDAVFAYSGNDVREALKRIVSEIAAENTHGAGEKLRALDVRATEIETRISDMETRVSNLERCSSDVLTGVPDPAPSARPDLNCRSEEKLPRLRIRKWKEVRGPFA